jgi:acyl-homoserine-lactone acylase
MSKLSSILLLTVTLLSAKTVILWDKYGVPHIFAGSIEEMFHAHGYAQMQNQADLLLSLYGESRGRAAEYWGEAKAPLDRWIHANGVPQRAKDWYAAQTPEFRKYLDAFARGINDHAAKHPNHVSPQYRQVLPVTAVDVVGHTLRAVHYMYMGSMNRLRTEIGPLLQPQQRAMLEKRFPAVEHDAGSNTWTVGPSRSASGKAMLIINPHLAWEGFYSYMEVHLNAPGYNLYGAPQIGFPTPVIGFNEHAGWGRTVNTIDTVDFYKLTVKGNQYQFDGAWKDFMASSSTMKIKQADGSYKTETITTRHSVHGPVVYDKDGVSVAMRVAGIDRPRMLEQWFRMGRAKNLSEFKDAMRMISVPMWNANFADDKGNIYLVCNGTIPRRKTGDWETYSKVLPGDRSDYLWTDYLKLEELPQSENPKSGFNQNANEQPWHTTLPQLDPAKYSPTLAPPLSRPVTFRTKRSLRMISEDQSITYDELIGYKHNTRVELADAVLPDLLGAKSRAADARTRRALEVLEKWDRHLDANSRGAVLFIDFSDRYFSGGDFINKDLRVPLNPNDTLNSAFGVADLNAALAALSQAAAHIEKTHGSLDVPYGDVYRYERGAKDLPGNGGAGRLGLFRTMSFSKKKGNRFYPAHGETFVCAIEFSTPQKANCVLGYGNASQPGSNHIDDQLQLMADKKMHPVWRLRKDIEANLERRESLN